MKKEPTKEKKVKLTIRNKHQQARERKTSNILLPVLEVSPYFSKILGTGGWGIPHFQNKDYSKEYIFKLTLPPMGYRILWLPWGGASEAPPP